MAQKINFEQLLEYVVNGESAKAEELFHQLVVLKSREIYENLIEDEMKDVDLDEASDEDDEEMDESTEDDEEEMDEAVESDDEEMDESTEDDEEMDENFGFEAMGGDATDDMMSDVGDEGESDDDGMDMDGGDDDSSLKSDIADLADKLDDLVARFDELMADEKNEPEHNDGIDDPDFGDEGGDDEGSEEDSDESMIPGAFEEEIEEIDLSPAAQMREYVEKVTAGHGAEKKGSGESGAYTKSVVAKKNDMGGTTANIAKGGTGSEKGTAGGLLAPTTKPQDGGNVNVPGSKNATKLTAVSKGHGAEKKGTGEAGGTAKNSLFK